jgi:hypothetical protein
MHGLGREGLSLESMALVLHCSLRTLSARMRACPELGCAYRAGAAEFQASVNVVEQARVQSLRAARAASATVD